jgi:hypothetical protein
MQKRRQEKYLPSLLFLDFFASLQELFFGFDGLNVLNDLNGGRPRPVEPFAYEIGGSKSI